MPVGWCGKRSALLNLAARLFAGPLAITAAGAHLVAVLPLVTLVTDERTLLAKRCGRAYLLAIGWGSKTTTIFHGAFEISARPVAIVLTGALLRARGAVSCSTNVVALLAICITGTGDTGKIAWH
jgi:hypothetical protein